MNPNLIPSFWDNTMDGDDDAHHPSTPSGPDHSPGSHVGGLLGRIQTGPSKLTINGNIVGHTMGGCKFNVQPDLRKRQVDEYGSHSADLLYQGEGITVSTTLAERTMTVLQLVYQWGYSINAVTQGLGKTPGATGQSKGARLVLHPLDIVGTQQDVTFYNAAVSSSGEVQFGVITADRVFNVVWSCLVDESIGSHLLGKIGGP